MTNQETQCIYGCPKGKHDDSAWVCYGLRENDDALVRSAIGARQERDRLEHRIVVLESRMENILARLDGHDLGFVTMTLDEQGKAALARMQRLAVRDRTNVPPEEGTPR